MSDNSDDDSIIEANVNRWGEVNAELKSLEGKNDPASRERFDELIEELMVVDMNLKPVKDAMKKAAEGKEPF